MKNFSVFISYKWEDEKRNKWVDQFYRDLRFAGIDAKLDKYEVAPGKSFSDYMTREIRECKHVLFIVTPKAVEAVESGEGALAFEMQISNARRLARKDGFQIIPIFREGKKTSSYLSDHRYIDFRDDEQYNVSLQYLIEWLQGSVKPPSLGKSKTKVTKIHRNRMDQNKVNMLADKTAKLTSELKESQRIIRVKEIELNAVLAQAEEVSKINSLTTLLNRRVIMNFFQRETVNSERNDTPLTILMLDIDNLKEINDSMGHIWGDSFLFYIADQLKNVIHSPNLIGRYGGDEFLIVMPNSKLKDGIEQASLLCRHIRSNPISVETDEHKITISIGIAQYRRKLENWQKFLSRADAALLAAKENGRDRWAFSN